MLFAAALLAALASPTRASDWPQWLGPMRDSVWHESGVLESFPVGGPKTLWRVPVAGGYAGPAVVGGRVFVTDYVRTQGSAVNDPSARPSLQGQERVLCLDAATGKLLWKYEYDCPYDISYPAGPRATPTVDGSLVYTLGAQGNLLCLTADGGKVVWQVDLKRAYGAPTPIWGFCAHPLVDGDKLITLAGGEGSVAVAFDKRTGKELWRALSATNAGYCPPTIIHAAGQKQLAIWHPRAINGLDPETGRLLWTVKLEPDFGMSINAPTQIGDYLFVSGIKNKGLLLKLTSAQPEVVWRVTSDIGIGPVHTPPVPVDNTLYGVNREGELTAVEIPSGKHLWETYQATTGTRRASSATAFLVRNGDRFFIMSETGELIIARLTPAGYTELGRAKILEPTHEAFGRNVLWSHPAFAHRAMFLRNDKELVCVSLAAE
jgi:outer membrane protein assembly factor BamB